MSPAATQVPTGTHIANRYRVVNHLGGGSDGDVYQVLDEHLDNEVALKLLAPKAGVPATWDEAQMLEQLRSEYLLPVLNADVVPGGDLRYVTTTHMTGGDLAEAAKDHGVAPQQAVRWGQQLAHGLDRVHAANLLHRDVKPGNSFLNAHGDVLLGDLGMAARMDADGTAAPYGTFITVAPEVIDPAISRCSVRSDVYSLGATVFYLAAGEYPVDHRLSRREMADKILAGDRRKLRDMAPQVPPGFARVVERALSTDPSERQPDALTIANQLSSFQHYARIWRRIVEHPGHIMCFHGDSIRSAQSVNVCVIPGRGRLVNVTVQGASGLRMRRHEKVDIRSTQIASTLRGLFPQI